MFGIDVSSNNSTINWDLVKTNDRPVEFAIIKATEGVGFLDPKLKVNAQKAKQAGLKISYYHFCSLNTLDVVKDSTAEAKYFLDAIKNLPANDLPLVLDIEKETVDLNKDQFLLWIKTFFGELEKAGKKYMIYSGSFFLDENLNPNHGLGHIPLWLAQYPNIYNEKLTPKLPKGWDDYYIWQYSSKGQIKGIKGNVDINKINPKNNTI